MPLSNDGLQQRGIDDEMWKQATTHCPGCGSEEGGWARFCDTRALEHQQFIGSCERRPRYLCRG